MWKSLPLASILPPSSPWPTLLNTGPRAIGRTTFTAWPFTGVIGAADYGNFPTDGQGRHVVEGYQISGTGANIDVTDGDKWLIRGCLFDMVNPAVGKYCLTIDAGVTNTTIEYCAFVSADYPVDFNKVPQTGGVDACIRCLGGPVEISHCQLAHFATGIKVVTDGVNVHDCFISYPRDDAIGTDHTDGIEGHGQANFIANHNWIDNWNTQTDTIALFGGAAWTNVAITNNYHAMNGTTPFPLSAGGACPVNTGVYTGNRFSTKYGRNSGYVTDTVNQGGDTNITWANNKQTDSAGLVDGLTVNIDNTLS